MNWYRTLILSIVISFVVQAAPAQTNLFSTALTVNGQAISNYEIDQRRRMARLLDIPGSTRAEAIDELINERLYFQEAERIGIHLPASILNQRIEQYAENSIGSTDRLYSQLRSNGISREVFREFARANVIWQDIKAIRFGAWAELLTAEDVNEQAEFSEKQTTRSINLSELILPVNQGSREQSLAVGRELRINITSLAAFREAVSVYSISSTKNNGGSIGWVPEASLPAAIRSAVSGVGAGSVTQPVIIENNVVLFYVHDRRTTTTGNTLLGLSYATASAENDGQLIRQAIAGVDTCNDLENNAHSIAGVDFSLREDVGQNEIPGALTALLNSLDVGEYRVDPDGQSVVMLCERNYLPSDENQDRVVESYRQNWLNLTGDAYLSRLRADAIIIRK